MPTAQYGPGRGRNISAQMDRGAEIYRLPPKEDMDLRKQAEGRLIGLRVNRYSWWVHWRECADYMLPRRYKWIITPNQMSQGLASLADSQTAVTVRGQLYRKASGKKKPDFSVPLKLEILEVQKKE